MARESQPSAKRAVRETARALRRHSERAIRFHSEDRHPRYATVLTADPWQVELHDGRLLLDDEDLVVSQGVEKYHAQHAVDPGDTVIVSEMDNGDYLLHDVVTDKQVPDRSDAITAPAGGGTVDSQARTAINDIRQALIDQGVTL